MAPPKITLHNRQRAVRLDLPALQAFASRLLAACLELPGKSAGELAGLDEVSIILVSDRRMAQLHRRFLHLPGPTDVITFQHGEIFVSVETARNQAGRFASSLEREIRLYITHGLLHLRGFDDKDAAGVAEMERLQEELVGSILQ
jgi:probable rRNA maturation factor